MFYKFFQSFCVQKWTLILSLYIINVLLLWYLILVQLSIVIKYILCRSFINLFLFEHILLANC